MAKGKRATANNNPASAIKWGTIIKGQKLDLRIEGELHRASFIKLRNDGRVAVRLDDGNKFRFASQGNEVSVTLVIGVCKAKGCNNTVLTGEDYCEKCQDDIYDQDATILNTPPRKKPKGFHHYGVEWNIELTNFRFTTDEGLYFYGSWRKTKNSNSNEIMFAIDMYAKRDEQEFAIDPIIYAADPRENIKSLNADICASATKWFFMSANDNVKNIDRLKKIVSHPTIHFRRIESIDRVLMKIREFRDTAIRCGGRRLLELTGDDPKQPTIYLTIDVSTQAFGLKGRVPGLKEGAVFDRVILKPNQHGTNKGAVHTNRPDAANVEALCKALKNTDNKEEQRKIRATLRRMGHRGGARAIRASLAVKQK